MHAQGPEVDVQALHVALFLPEPAGGGVDEAARVQGPQPVIGFVGAELSPALVEDGPEADAGVLVQGPHRLLHGPEEAVPGLRVPVPPPVRQAGEAECGKERVVAEGVVAVVDHVLEHHHAQPVAVIVELLRLDLDVLAQGVEAQGLHGADVPLVALRIRRGIEPVAPVALVQQTVEEIGPAVEAEPGQPIHRLHLQGPQGKVGFHRVPAAADGEGVELRVLRTPQPGPFDRDARRAVPERILPPLQTDRAIR